MVGASFNNIGAKSIKLSDLSVSGYEEVPYFCDCGVMGEFQIKVLNMGGSAATDRNGKQAIYCFNRTWDGEWLDDACWTYEDGSNPGEIAFDAGEGLWFFVSGDAYESGDEKYSLVSAGEAMLDAGSVLLRNGNKGVVAPLSASVPLSKISVSGYEEVPYFCDCGVMGEFQIKVLNMGGSAATDKNNKPAIYCFNRTYDGEWYDDACWTYEDGSDPGEITFELGEGLWVFVSGDAYEAGTEKYYLDFPGIDDLAK